MNVQCPIPAHLFFFGCVLAALPSQLEPTSGTDALNILIVQYGRMRFGTHQIFHFGVFQQLFKQILFFGQCVCVCVFFFVLSFLEALLNV